LKITVCKKAVLTWICLWNTTFLIASKQNTVTCMLMCVHTHIFM